MTEKRPVNPDSNLFIWSVRETSCPVCGSAVFVEKEAEETDDCVTWICSKCGEHVKSDTLIEGDLVEFDIEGVPI